MLAPRSPRATVSAFRPLPWSRRALAARARLAGLVIACASSRGGASRLVPALTVDRSLEASDCPDADELTARIERILQRPPPDSDGSPQPAPLRIAVHFARRSTAYTAELEFSGPQAGERHLLDRSGSCEALAEAVGVTIALALDRELEEPARPTSAPEQQDSPRRPSVAPRPESAPPRAAASGRAWDLRALVDGGPVFGFGGPVAFAIGQHWHVRFRHAWLFGVGANAILPGTTDAGTGKLRTSWLFGSVRGCHLWGGSISVGPCALFGAGRLRGVGIGFRQPRSEDLTWTALGAGLLAQGPLWGGVVWGLSGTLWAPLRSLTFSVENAGVIWRSSPVSGGISAGVGVRLW